MKIRRFKHINEDNPQQQPAATPAPNNQPAQNQPNNGQQPVNNQQQQPVQNQQQNNQQPQQPQIDYNACATNINKFVGNLYVNIQKTIKDNLEKNCPELSNILKDNNSPMKDQAKTLNDAFANLNKLTINPDDPKTAAPAIEEFANFISALTSFNTQLANMVQQNQQQQGNQQQTNNNQPAQNQMNNGQQAANNQQQPTGNVNASYDTNNFGKKLYEKLKMNQYKKHILNNY